MKTTFFILSTILAILSFSGCGEDRSHGVLSSNLQSYGDRDRWITDTQMSKEMIDKNFIYIPGGFDVDGDGIDEGGFWLAKYEAKENNSTDLTINLDKIPNIENFIVDNFQLFNPDDKYKRFNGNLKESSNFLKVPASSIERLKVSRVLFREDGLPIDNLSPLEAAISLKNSQIEGGYEIKLPTEKQWMQIVQLVINNPENWTSNEVGKGRLYQGDTNTVDDQRYFIIENSILGEDEYIPKNYRAEVYDLAGSLSEWTSGLFNKDHRFLTGDKGEHEFIDINNIPLWWKPILKDRNITLSSKEGAGKYHDGFAKAGANDSLNITGSSGNVSKFAVVARGGSNSIDDVDLVGISAAKLSYGMGYKGPTVGFRAASDYLY